MGVLTLQANTTGNSNTAVGQQALYLNTTASNNTAVGFQSGYSNTTGSPNTAVGFQSLRSTTTGSQNNSFGYQTLYSNSTGNYNVGIGDQALFSNTTSSYSTAVGYQSGIYSTGSYNTLMGAGAGQGVSGATTGNANTAIGFNALVSIRDGSENVSIGTNSLATNSSGSLNTALGTYALNSNTTASQNTAVGYQSLYSTTTGNYNTSLGLQAGYYITTGTYNTCLGISSGSNLTTGTGNTYIGYNTVASSGSVNYELVWGTGSTGKGGSTGFINPASGSVYQGNNSTLWAVTSDQRLKKNIVDNNIGLYKITQIQVRNFEYRLPEEITDVDSKQAINKTGIQLGAIAQELQQVLPECVKQESTGVYTVDADPLIWYLINAVKELKAEIDQLKGA